MTRSATNGRPELENLLEEVAGRLEAGEALDVEAFAAAHPEHAEQLRRVLPTMLLLADLGRSASASGAAPPTGNGDAEPAGGVLGDFRIVREVGRGGMGVVHEAEQISLGRRVALKVLPFAATMDPRQLQRFHNEARAAAGLHHTNIVPVYAVGCDRGVHYYAMQFIAGRTLAEFIAERRGGPPSQVPTMPAAEAAAAATAPAVDQATSAAPRHAAYFRRVAEWGIQAAEALDCAHAVGVIHRDVKPANLLIDDSGRLWVTDFGLAQVQGDARLTMTGDLVGTPRYMSPEQALATRVVVDHRTDVYSLGATLYELLTLQPAFAGRDRQELLRQIAFEEPKPPRRLNKAIPPELEAIVLKALEKNPADRYATAKELADDLRRWQDGRLIWARRPTPVQRAQKWLRRHPAVMRSAMLMLLLATVGSATGTWLVWQEQRRTQLALAGEQKQRQSAERAIAIVGRVLRDLDPQAEEEGRPELGVHLTEQLDEAARILETELILPLDFPNTPDQQLDPLTATSLCQWVGRIFYGRGQYGKAYYFLECALRKRQAMLGPAHPITLSSKEDLAVVAWAQELYDEAEKLFQELLQARIIQRGVDDPATLRCKFNLAGVYRDQGQYDRAMAIYKEVLQAITARLGPDHPNTLGSKSNLAALHWRMRKFDQSVPLFEGVVRGYKETLGVDHFETLHAIFGLAVNYRDAGHLGEAVALFDEHLPRARTFLPPGSPTRHFGLTDGAETYARAGRFDKAEPLLRELADLAKQAGAKSPPYATEAPLYASQPYAARLAVLGQRYAEVEPLLLQGSDGMKQCRGKIAQADLSRLTRALLWLRDTCHGEDADRWRRKLEAVRAGQVGLPEALERLVQLYDAWDKKDEADHWRKELEAARAEEIGLPEALQRLVQLLDASGKKDQADYWRKELDATRAKPEK
jgi:serine/threonine protein kinase